MRRVSSYGGGPSGVAGSERLKQRLSSTPGLHLLSSSPSGEAGFFAAAGAPQDERVIHRTFGAARNFYAIASTLKQAPKRESWVSPRDPFASVVKETTVYYEHPHSNGVAPAKLVEEVDERHCSTPGENGNGEREGAVAAVPEIASSDNVARERAVEAVSEVASNDSKVGEGRHSSSTGVDDNAAREGAVGSFPEIASNDSQMLEGVSGIADNLPSGLSDNQGGHLVAGEVGGSGTSREIDPPSFVPTALAEDSLSTSPILVGQESLTSRVEHCETDTASNVCNLSNEKSLPLETGVCLQVSDERAGSENLAAVKIQNCWRGWKQRKNFQQVRARLVYLQSLARRNQEFKQYRRTLQAVILLQKSRRVVQSIRALQCLKTEQALREHSKINNAAIVVQKYWRSFQSRRLLSYLRMEREVRDQLRRDHAAVVVQKHWRSVQSRSLLSYLRMERDVRDQQRSDRAAIVMQKHWRSGQSRRLLSYLRLERAVRDQQRSDRAAVMMQKHWRARRGRCLVKHLKIEHSVKEKQRVVNAAIVLQKCWRAWQARYLMKHLRMEQVSREKQRTNDSAIVLQKHWRAHQDRCLVRHLRTQHAVREQQKVSDAAVVVQKCWRAQQDRRLVKTLKSEQAMREQQKICNAVLVLQKHWRAKEAKRLLEHLKMEHLAWAQERNTDAIVLQKHWRAKQGRCLVKQMRVDQVEREQQSSNNAAVVLQKHWRAKQGRCLVQHLRMDQVEREQQRTNNAAVVLQKHWRAKQGRCLVKNLKMDQVEREQQSTNNAAVVMQKHWRAQQGRCLVKHLKIDQVEREQQRTNGAAVVMQKHWRARQGRCLVKHLKMDQVEREQQRTNNAAVVLQKHWRAKQGKFYVNRLKLEQVARKQHKINQAALVIQEHWRAHQTRCLVKRLRAEEVVKEEQRTNHATLVVQKHWRALCGRSLVKHLKTELAAKEMQRIDDASIVIQKHWRAHQSRALAERGRTEQLLRQYQIDNAATVLQKHWRGWKRVKDLKEKQRVEKAAIVVQIYWRAHQSRLTVKIELASREESQRASAAIALQKHWRARKSLLLVKHLRTEESVRQQKRVHNAATVFQKHWRTQYSRLAVKSLKSEQALRKPQRFDNAAVVLQKHWRGFQSRQVVSLRCMEQAARERAALRIQARVRDNATRTKYKAAQTIQKAWQLYCSTRLTVSAVSIQHGDQKRKIQAIIVLQAYARGFVVRQRLREVARCISMAEDSLESFRSSSFVKDVDPELQTLGECYNTSPDEWQNSEYVPINSQKRDLNDSDSEFSAASFGGLQLQNNVVKEDWNYVEVDQLGECLDTCLATLKPLPSGSRHYLPGLDVPEKSEQVIATDHQSVDRVTSAKESATDTYEMVKQVPRTSSGMQSDQVALRGAPMGTTGFSAISAGQFQENGTQEMDKPVQGRALGRRTLKQNEERLKQFAQVFLLQRSIALQQQRAQAAPPFPPPMMYSGSEIPSHKVAEATPSVGVDSGNQGEAVVRTTGLYTDAQPSQVDGGRSEAHHIVCEIDDPDNEQAAVKGRVPASQNSGAKQVTEIPRPDVVLDMVLLLRRIEEEYGTSEGDYDGESSTWCTSGCGDIEQGMPLLGGDPGSIRRESSMAKLANAVSIKRISIPDVNAVLLVFIAMVVYTRTVCKGLFFGARQAPRRP